MELARVFTGFRGVFPSFFRAFLGEEAFGGSLQAAGLIRDTETGTSGITACGRTDAIHYLW